MTHQDALGLFDARLAGEPLTEAIDLGEQRRSVEKITVRLEDTGKTLAFGGSVTVWAAVPVPVVSGAPMAVQGSTLILPKYPGGGWGAVLSLRHEVGPCRVERARIIAG